MTARERAALAEVEALAHSTIADLWIIACSIDAILAECRVLRGEQSRQEERSRLVLVTRGERA